MNVTIDLAKKHLRDIPGNTDVLKADLVKLIAAYEELENNFQEEIKSLVQKWDDRVEIHRRVCSEPLMFTKKERLENSHYAQAICAVIADVKKLTDKTE